MSDPALEIRQLALQIGDRRILDGIELSVAEACSVSVIGPNGAGKSTFLRCINAILAPTSGEVRLFGAPTSTLTQRQIGRLVAYVPQLDGRALRFRARDFVAMGRYPHLGRFATLSSRDEEVVDGALELASAADLSDRSLDTLSGGERQKVFIAAALAQEARLLLLDEPLTYLDYRHQREIASVLRRINRDSGVTIVVVTHALDRGVFEGDAVVALKEGRVVFDGPPAALLEGNTLERIYDTHFDLVDGPAGAYPIVVPAGDH